MNFKNVFFIVALVGAVTLTSCSARLVDFTVISSKNVNLNIDRSKGVKTEGSKTYFLGIGWNIKDGMDLALENAGPEYDLLVDGVVRYTSLPFFSIVKVEGLAVSSSAMIAEMGQEGFEKWLQGQDVLTEENAVVITE